MDKGGMSEVERIATAAGDALTDEMVGRLAGTVGEGLELLDQVNRAGLGNAIPALAQMVHDGDLERLVQLARVYGSMQDALTDEMVGRLAETVGNGMSLLDRFNRGGSDRLIQLLEHLEGSGALEGLASTLPKLTARLDQVVRMLGCVEEAANILDRSPARPGGVGGLWSLLKDPENQKSLHFLILLGKQLTATCAQESR